MKPVILVVSDALGDTAQQLARAAAGQFDSDSICIERLAKVRSSSDVETVLAPRIERGEAIAVLYTIASPELRGEVAGMLDRLGVPSVDALGPVLSLLTALTGDDPCGIAGSIHRTDEVYFRRIEAMEYFVEHDDGRGAEDLSDADIVLIGVSRTGKTPLSMYLAHLGYRVANIPLALGLEPPASLFSVDPARIFGLISTTDVVSAIRNSRLGDDAARAVAGSYADPENVSREMDEARALIRRLGCFSVRTDGKAIEESAAEIIGRIEQVARRRAHRNSTFEN